MSHKENKMKVTIEVDGGEAEMHTPEGQAPRRGPEIPTTGTPEDVVARAKATGALSAGPAPSAAGRPGASAPEAASQPMGQGIPSAGQGKAAGAAPGAAPDVVVELPIADDDSDENGD